MKRSKLTLLAVVAATATAAAMWFSNGPVSPKETTWDDVVAEAENGGYRLISTNDLWKRYSEQRESLLLVDTRQEWEYRSGHIKGAVNFPMEPTWWTRWQKKGALSRFLGEDKDRLLIFY